MTREEAIKALRETYCGNRAFCELFKIDRCRTTDCEIYHAIKALEAEPIVSCKDCKYFEEIMTARFRDGTTKEVQICKKRVPLKDENFYCGWGARKESEVYCDRNLCTLNEYNGVGCDERQEKRRGEVKE